MTQERQVMILEMTQQNLWNIVGDLPDNKKQLVWNFAISLRDSEKESEESIIDIADQAAEATTRRLTHEEVFNSIRGAINAL